MLKNGQVRATEPYATSDVRVVDLCCGMGGLSVAARQMGMRVVAGDRGVGMEALIEQWGHTRLETGFNRLTLHLTGYAITGRSNEGP
jgi:2-polyprenyl-3-methyl-5-hydroxy-6-metoxy-1,4-benzoquinol methylase